MSLSMNSRKRMRTNDIEESYYLLLEMACCEPVIQECFNILESICLSHGVKVKQSKPEFQRHIDRYWLPFLRHCIRAMYIYGFIPYRIKKLSSGDKIPEVLPPGTFRWSTVVDKESQDILNYKITMTSGNKEIENIHIEPWTQPNYQVSENSILYATISSPISYVIESYKILQDALKRQAHADAWNCTARLAISSEPKEYNHDTQRKELFNTFGLIDDFTAKDNLSTFEENTLNHMPSVYDMPKYRHLESAPTLKPCSDIPFLQNKYRYDVCYLTGVPPDLIAISHSSNPEHVPVSKSNGTNRLFQARCQSICQFLKNVASTAYERIYKTSAEFDIVPMPRLEIQSIGDLTVLHETGILRPDHSVKLSDILLGSLKTK